MICKKKTATGNVEGFFSFVMKAGGFHHKNLATFFCHQAFWLSDIFLMDVGHLHQKSVLRVAVVTAVFLMKAGHVHQKNVKSVDNVVGHFF